MDVKTVLALRAASVDMEGALRRFGGRSELYERYLLQFPADENFSKIGPALSAQDWEGALMAAHTLKGLSANLGMDRLFRACDQVVCMLRAEEREGIAAAYAEMESAYDELCAALALETFHEG